MENTHNNIVKTFAGKTILILGDVILDEYIWGRVRRISPEAPVPVVEFESKTHRLGGAGNVAANVQSLGGLPLLGCVVGTDAQGDLTLELVSASAMDSRGILVVKEHRTTTKSRLMAHNQQIARIDYERTTPLSTALEDELLFWAEKRISEADALILSDYGKGVVSPRLAERFVSLARQHSKAMLVDPKGTNFAKYRGATLVKPNLHEIERLFNCEIHCEDDLCEAGQRLLNLLPGSSVLVTRGRLGMSLFRENLPPLHIPSIARNVFDVTGAGDTVASTLALAMAVAADMETAAHIANRAAGVVVGKLGTAQVTIDELLDTEFLEG